MKIRLDDDLQLLDLAELHLIEEVVEGNLGAGVEDFFLLLGLSLLNKGSRESFIGNRVEGIAACRHLVQTRDLNGNRGTCGLYALALVVGHDADASDAGARDDDVALVQRSVLNENRRDGTSALVKTRLDNGTLRGTVGIGLQLLHLRDESDHFEQVVKTLLCLGGNGDARCIAAPLLGNEVVLGQLLLDLLGIRAVLIHLVDGDDDGNARCFRVVDRLNGLGHDAVVRRDNEDRDIGNHRASRAHGGERFVTGGIEEGDGLAVDLHAVRADVLGDAARFACGDVGVADRVEDRGLAVVNVSHDNDDGRSADEIRLVVLAVVDQLLLDRDDDLLLYLGVELHRQQGCGIKVDSVVGGDHRAHHKRLLDDLRDGGFQPESQLVDGDLVGDLDGDRLLLALERDSLETLRLGLALALTSALLLLGAVRELLLLGGVVAVGAA